MAGDQHNTGLTPDHLLAGYAAGIFPMSEGRDDPEVFWVDPKRRGVLPIDGFHKSRSLARRIRRGNFRATSDVDFLGVVAACADRDETWINAPITELYHQLHLRGRAHSVEIWDGETLIGGTYGVTLGRAWFGESMFSRQVDGSKMALACLTATLHQAGFTLFDTQFLTPHLASLGAVEISRSAYHAQLHNALADVARFPKSGELAL